MVDSGIGIPPEKQRLIFEPFRQADTSSTAKIRRDRDWGLAFARNWWN